MAAVELAAISKAFGPARVLNGIDLDIADGEFVVFVGPSGCGKSTLLRVIAGLEKASSGAVRIAGREVSQVGPAERGVAMVFQSYALYPHLSVYENMAFALKLAKTPKGEVDRAVRTAAESLSITHLLDRKPKQLSGGQRQRVAIGRAIVRKPEVFLFDEPLSNLDAALRVRMRYEFARLHQQLGATMIYVTHDQVEAMTLADKIVVLSEGRVEQVGAPMQLYQHPANLFVAGFIGSPRMNFMAGEIVEAGERGASVRLPSGEVLRAAVDASRAKLGEKATLGVRPESFGRGGANAALTVDVRFVESLGSATFAYGQASGADGDLIVELPGDQPVSAGDRLALSVASEAAYLFDADGRAFRRFGG